MQVYGLMYRPKKKVYGLMKHVLFWQCLALLTCMVRCSPPEDPIRCFSTTTNCTITNSYGSFPDRSTCRAGEVVYPSSEEELVAAVAKATKRRRKMKVATRYSHSIPKLACPGGDDGVLISTRFLNRTVSINAMSMEMTVESGVLLKEVIKVAAEAGLALPNAPIWWGLTMGGLLSTGAHGSSLRGKGGAVHEYVVGLRIVTPASSDENFAIVRSLDADHPDLNAAKVSLGVLGVISQVTLRLQPIFKTSLNYSYSAHDFDLADRAVIFGNQHEFAHIIWYPGHGRVVYGIEDRVSSNDTGNGLYDFIGFRQQPTAILASNRRLEERQEATSNAEGKCKSAKLLASTVIASAYGLTNNGTLFTGYPVIGYQNRMESSGSCIDSLEDGLLTSCPWDPRANGSFFLQTTISIGLSKVRDFILDVQKLRDLDSKALCSVELYSGIVMRYVKASTAYMGKEEDAVDFDIVYYRSHDPMVPRLYEDVLEEIEQMALFKYGGLPHWGKNRNLAFDGVSSKYLKSGDFLKVKRLYDPHGLFSSEWTDQILGIKGKASIVRDGCALEGLCICSEDTHCAPKKGYFCRPGKVFTEARVCTRVEIPTLRMDDPYGWKTNSEYIMGFSSEDG